MDKEDVVCIYERNNAIYSNTAGLGDCHTEWSKSERETNIIWYCLYVESKKKGTNKLIYKTEIELQM